MVAYLINGSSGSILYNEIFFGAACLCKCLEDDFLVMNNSFAFSYC